MADAQWRSSRAHAGHGHSQDDLKRWAGLEGWWIVAGIIALLIALLLKTTIFA